MIGRRALQLRRDFPRVLLAALLFTVAVAVYHAVRLRQEALESHRTMAQGIARVGERELTVTLHMLDRILETRAEQWADGGYLNAADFEQRLRGDLTGVAALRSFSVIGVDGNVLASTLPEFAGRRLGAQAVQTLNGGAEGAQMRVSIPWVGRDLDDGIPAAAKIDVTRTPFFFTLMRRGQAPGRRFVISATLNPEFFSSFFATMAAREEFAVELYRYDGLMLLTTGNDARGPGYSAAGEPIFAQLLADREIGVLPQDASSGESCILAFHASRNYPLVVVARLPQQAVLADWRAEMKRLAAAVSFAFACLLLLGYLWHRQQRRRREEQLAARAELETAARVFDSAYDGILITDAERRILRVNRAFTKITGFTEDEVRGRAPSAVAPELHDGPFYELIWDSVGEHGVWDGEVLSRRKNGEIFPQQLTVSAVRDTEGKISNYIGLFSDITERKRAEAELLRAKDVAESANLAKSRFLATMSHEIRTPMNGILGMAQLLMMPDLTEAERLEFARTVLSSGETLLALLNDILDLSKVEAGRLELQESVFEPEQVLGDTVRLFSEAAQQKRLSLSQTWHGLPGRRYRADPVRLRQMLSNLVSNALKFTEHGEVCIDAEEIPGPGNRVTLRFSIQDTGIGIATDAQSRLFQPFTQLDSSTTRAAGGTGLGLSIVRNLAQLMGGEAGVQSVPGRGSRFWFTLQAQVLAEGEDAQVATREMDSAVVSASRPRLRGRVLVVEDNLTNRHVVQAMLNRLGVESESAENGALALDLLTHGTPPAMVLMDCRMPVMDGLVATVKLREWERENQRPHLPVVALTANAFPEDRDDCLRAGMDDFLAKPVSLGDLRAALQRWLGPVAVVPGADLAETFARASLITRNDGDPELAKIAAQAYMEDSAFLLDAACRGVETAQTETALQQLTNLRAAAGAVCADALVASCKRIESELQSGARVAAVALLGTLRRRAAELELALADFLAR
ncbi:ATP-binding protein [Niveibacterium sp. SC-1]|uniref:hybrid sensor histidine kinase/response regulator n=1 Tax=Niveibacterium sp. SC-1 TaxID=3135646 RepID=UPI00311F3BB7